MADKLIFKFGILVSILLFLSPVFAQVPVPAAKPVPSATPTPSPSPAATESLADLQNRIRSRMQRPGLQRGQIGIKIASLSSGKTVFENNAEKYFIPASNMKNFTVAAALEKLTPNFRFVTSIYAPSLPDTSGTIKGNLRIFGRGDISVSTAFTDGDLYKGLDNIADKIAAAGVKRVEGDLVADESYFSGDATPLTWELGDLQWYYGAEVSALPLNDNAIELSVGAGIAGYSCIARVTPINSVFRIDNRCRTEAAGTPRTLKIEKKPGQNVLEITGVLPVGDRGFTGYVTVSRPAELFAALLKQRLAEKGIVVTGRTRSVNEPQAVSPESVEIAKHESPPLSVIVQKTMKPSQNMYTETLLWTLGENARARRSAAPGERNGQRTASADLGISEVKSFLAGIGVPSDAVIQHDGSGMSRRNLVTPSSVVRLYTYMSRESRYAHAWRESLTIAGVDGTLRNRMKGTRAYGNFRGKTGTVDQVSALSGYLTTAGGEQLVVSIIVNGVNAPSDRTSMIDDIVMYLAGFNGKVDQ